MTIGLTWRRTARRIKRLKQTVLAISPDYLESPDPRLFGALVISRHFRRLDKWLFASRLLASSRVFALRVFLGNTTGPAPRILRGFARYNLARNAPAFGFCA